MSNTWPKSSGPRARLAFHSADPSPSHPSLSAGRTFHIAGNLTAQIGSCDGGGVIQQLSGQIVTFLRWK